MEAVVILAASLSLSLKAHVENWELIIPVVSQVEEVRDAMESEMRTQLRRQAAAHTDHLRDVLRVQEQELKHGFEQVRTWGRASAALQPPLPFTWTVSHFLFMCSGYHSLWGYGRVGKSVMAPSCGAVRPLYICDTAAFYRKMHLCIIGHISFVSVS